MTRCPAALWLRAHDAHWRQARDAAGRAVVPHALVWACWRCGRALGVTQVNQARGAAAGIGDEIPVRRTSGRREITPPRLVVVGTRRQQAR
jgi:hypothetical protein